MSCITVTLSDELLTTRILFRVYLLEALFKVSSSDRLSVEVTGITIVKLKMLSPKEQCLSQYLQVS